MINYEAFEPLVNHLKSIGPFLFRPNSGNGGDAVIALSCMNIFDHSLDWQMYTPERYKKCKAIVYSGGATFAKYFSLANFLSTHKNDLESFTIDASASFEGHEQLIAMDERFHIFAREKIRLSILRELRLVRIFVYHTIQPLRSI